jgi:hypothetical protein
VPSIGFRRNSRDEEAVEPPAIGEHARQGANPAVARAARSPRAVPRAISDRSRIRDARRGSGRAAPRLPAARANRWRRPACRRASPMGGAGQQLPDCSAAISAISEGRTRWSTSGWRRKIPVALHGASSSTASAGASGAHLSRSAAITVASRARCVRDFREVARDDFPRTSTAVTAQPARRAGASCRPAQRKDRAPCPALADQPGRKRGGDDPAPTNRLRRTLRCR